MRVLLLVVALVLAGCAAAPPAVTPAPTPIPSPTTSPTATPGPSVDRELADAVTDALASMDEITRLRATAATADASTYRLIGDVASSERTSLASRPARITTRREFHVLDLVMQLFEAASVTEDPAELDGAMTQLGLSRPEIAALAP